MIEYYLGEAPLLKNVETYDLGDHDQREHVLARPHAMVVKPVDGSGRLRLVGSRRRRRGAAKVRADVEEDPRLDRAADRRDLDGPTFVGEAASSRHVDLRPFAVNDGDDIWCCRRPDPRRALPAAASWSSSQGGGSKDTWVLDDGVRPATACRARRCRA